MFAQVLDGRSLPIQIGVLNALPGRYAYLCLAQSFKLGSESGEVWMNVDHGQGKRSKCARLTGQVMDAGSVIHGGNSDVGKHHLRERSTSTNRQSLQRPILG
jgi:hypothetical protein